MQGGVSSHPGAGTLPPAPCRPSTESPGSSRKAGGPRGAARRLGTQAQGPGLQVQTERSWRLREKEASAAAATQTAGWGGWGGRRSGEYKHPCRSGVLRLGALQEGNAHFTR